MVSTYHISRLIDLHRVRKLLSGASLAITV
jgi:hypothetical protein